MATIAPEQLFEEVKQRCYCFRDGRCIASKRHNPPEVCNYEGCPSRKFEWLHTPGYKILCDFGQCEKGAMVSCPVCKACVCLDHQAKHLRSCEEGWEPYARMRYEQEIIDGKKWDEG
ncbi:hypothetical protein MUP01_12170 [Candidatus Bathyarchaeota archaeon]|nr:hypothetical protein [Candidatus Bathyarchaeota archaeon]